MAASSEDAFEDAFGGEAALKLYLA